MIPTAPARKGSTPGQRLPGCQTRVLHPESGIARRGRALDWHTGASGLRRRAQSSVHEETARADERGPLHLAQLYGTLFGGALGESDSGLQFEPVREVRSASTRVRWTARFALS